MKLSPSAFLRALRESFEGSEDVYTEGSCVHLYRVLKLVFPSALPYWSDLHKHCYTRIGNRYYDITGVVAKPSDVRRVYSAASMSIAVARKVISRGIVYDKPVKL